MQVATAFAREVETFDERLREGRFQQGLALLAGMSALPSGLEVAYEHYKGSYGNPVMYTPVIASAVLAPACFAGVFSGRAARTWMRWAGYVTFADCVIGFGFHVRGIARKPGGWRLPITNIVMGPPIFAPLLFGTAAYLAIVASYMRRGDGAPECIPARHQITWEQDVREGRFQRHMALTAAAAAFFSSFEAWYSHYKNRFQYKVQWSPLVVGAALVTACVASAFSARVAQRLLPAVSAVAIANGAIGFGYHMRGIVRRPGGLKQPVYNVLYGPPIFAPLLFAACGLLGILASRLRRER